MGREDGGIRTEAIGAKAFDTPRIRLGGALGRAAVVLCALGILSALPGIFEAPTALLRVVAATGVAGSALIILLVALPGSRRAYA